MKTKQKNPADSTRRNITAAKTREEKLARKFWLAFYRLEVRVARLESK